MFDENFKIECFGFDITSLNAFGLNLNINSIKIEGCSPRI